MVGGSSLPSAADISGSWHFRHWKGPGPREYLSCLEILHQNNQIFISVLRSEVQRVEKYRWKSSFVISPLTICVLSEELFMPDDGIDCGQEIDACVEQI